MTPDDLDKPPLNESVMVEVKVSVGVEEGRMYSTVYRTSMSAEAVPRMELPANRAG